MEKSNFRSMQKWLAKCLGKKSWSKNAYDYLKTSVMVKIKIYF